MGLVVHLLVVIVAQLVYSYEDVEYCDSWCEYPRGSQMFRCCTGTKDLCSEINGTCVGSRDRCSASQPMRIYNDISPQIKLTKKYCAISEPGSPACCAPSG
ncbi:unnamed protein product, partial [Meganyctiphanes norvegica]